MSQAVLVTLDQGMDRVTLSVPSEPAFYGTLRLVIGGIASRCDLPYDQMNELQLAVEALVSHRSPGGDTIVIEAAVEERAVSVAIGPFVPENDSGGWRVVERLVASARVVGRDDGTEWVELVAGGTSAASPSSVQAGR